MNIHYLSSERIMSKFSLLRFLFVLLVFASHASAQFVHTEHKQIVAAAGKPLLIRATNLGNWMVPEGYMCVFEDGPQSPSQIHALVLQPLGPQPSPPFCHNFPQTN